MISSINVDLIGILGKKSKKKSVLNYFEIEKKNLKKMKNENLRKS